MKLKVGLLGLVNDYKVIFVISFWLSGKFIKEIVYRFVDLFLFSLDILYV